MTRPLPLALAPALLLGACAPAAPTGTPFAAEHPLNVAHQGGEDLWPSNTMLAFGNAAALGADMLDTDMHATRDGVLVLSHDATLDRLTDTRGRIADLTFAQVRAADAGYRFTPDGGRTFPFRGRGVRVPTLTELLRAFPGMPLSIEIKQASPSIGAPFCRALRAAGATGRVLVSSFSDAAIHSFRAACPEVATSLTGRELRPLVLLGKVGLGWLAPLPGRAAQVPVQAGGITVVTRGFVNDMHSRGAAVQVWTVNDPEEMRRLTRMGVDGILTDRPDLLRAVLAQERGR